MDLDQDITPIQRIAISFKVANSLLHCGISVVLTARFSLGVITRKAQVEHITSAPLRESGRCRTLTICIQLGQEIGTKVVTSTQSQIQTCLCPASILLDVTDIDGIRVNYGNRESGSNAARIAIQSAEPAYGIIGIMHMYRGFGWHRCRKTWRPTGLPNPKSLPG